MDYAHVNDMQSKLLYDFADVCGPIRARSRSSARYDCVVQRLRSLTQAFLRTRRSFFHSV